MGPETEELYRQLVEEHSDTVTRLALVHTGNYADAEDCYQNVFFKLFKELGKAGLPPNPKAWLIRVTVNECRSMMRYRLRRNYVELEKIEAAVTDQSDLETLDLVFRLSPKYRDVIYLYYYEQYSIEEIARMTGTNVNTIKSRLKRGRDKLRDILDD